MKMLASHRIIFVWLSFLFVSACHPDEKPLPVKGKVSFSLSNYTGVIPGGRISETTVPAFVLLSVKDGQGSLRENVKLPLLAFGTGYISDNLELPTGSYTLTQFVVLDAANRVIYASPLEGSDLARFVSQPLPLDFNVGVNQTTQVIPQVLQVTQNNGPSNFGYANFQFEVVKVGALHVDLSGVEEITKVSYQFSNSERTISSEVVPNNSRFDLNNPELLEKTWQVRILAWTAAAHCYQKVYRFSGQITFDGSVIELPQLQNGSWVPFYYKEISSIGIFRSIDPRTSYQVEVQFPAGKHGYGYVDRFYWDQKGNELCDGQFSDFSGGSGEIARVVFYDQAECSSGSDHYQVDSFLSVNIGTFDSPILVQDYFNWDVINSLASPVCEESSATRRIGATRIR